MTATIRDVARRAGVSVATVSRLVNGTGRVREKTAERIRDAISVLGFRPNVVGRSLKTAHTMALGVVIPSMSNPIFADTVAGINEAARSLGYTLMFTSTDYDAAEEERAVSALLGYRVDGLILTVADPEHSTILDALDRDRVPYVLVHNQPSPRRRPTVAVDNVAAGRAVADALLALGHARVGMISGRFSASDRAEARHRGFVQRLAQLGAPPPAVREVSFLEQDMESVLAPLYTAGGEAPTALFCSNDLLAIAVIGALSRLRFQVPHDVSVIGFDGIAVGTHLHPTLATIVQPAREMGRAAAVKLTSRLAGREEPAVTILPHVLRLGESAGQAARRATDADNNLHGAQRRTPS